MIARQAKFGLRAQISEFVGKPSEYARPCRKDQPVGNRQGNGCGFQKTGTPPVDDSQTDARPVPVDNRAQRTGSARPNPLTQGRPGRSGCSANAEEFASHGSHARRNAVVNDLLPTLHPVARPIATKRVPTGGQKHVHLASHLRRGIHRDAHRPIYRHRHESSSCISHRHGEIVFTCAIANSEPRTRRWARD